MVFVDRELTCANCGATFVFSAGEQQFFKDKGFTHDPKRCKGCKAKRKVETHVKCAECGCPFLASVRALGLAEAAERSKKRAEDSVTRMEYFDPKLVPGDPDYSEHN